MTTTMKPDVLGKIVWAIANDESLFESSNQVRALKKMLSGVKDSSKLTVNDGSVSSSNDNFWMRRSSELKEQVDDLRVEISNKNVRINDLLSDGIKLKNKISSMNAMRRDKLSKAEAKIIELNDRISQISMESRKLERQVEKFNQPSEEQMTEWLSAIASNPERFIFDESKREVEYWSDGLFVGEPIDITQWMTVGQFNRIVIAMGIPFNEEQKARNSFL